MTNDSRTASIKALEAAGFPICLLVHAARHRKKAGTGRGTGRGAGQARPADKEVRPSRPE